MVTDLLDLLLVFDLFFSLVLTPTVINERAQSEVNIVDRALDKNALDRHLSNRIKGELATGTLTLMLCVNNDTFLVLEWFLFDSALFHFLGYIMVLITKSEDMASGVTQHIKNVCLVPGS
jgi:hypothetical protein